jgi:8-oxo-dGTP pyrophosphatase MutT (NUDIX family)
MLETTDRVEPVYPAATVVLLRNGNDGLETLLVQRSNAVKHMGGMWVFPGGRVDDADSEGDDEYRAAMNAAIRETQEEAGLAISADQLVYLSHWTTPEGAKKRFATWFFLALLEDDQEVVVDGGEIADHRWVRPADALKEMADPGHPLRFMPPTYVSLVELEPYSCCHEARTAIEGQTALVFAPRMAFVDDGLCFLYAEDAGYESGDPSIEGPRHRMYMAEDQLDYVRQLQPLRANIVSHE